MIELVPTRVFLPRTCARCGSTIVGVAFIVKPKQLLDWIRRKQYLCIKCVFGPVRSQFIMSDDVEESN